MKKVLLSLSAVIVIGVFVLLLILRSSSGFKSIYFVPQDAMSIIETNDPLDAWDKLVYSKAWNHYSTNDLFAELNKDLQAYDSLVNSSKFLLKIIGQKKVTISQHPVGNKKYDFIYIIDAGKVGKMKKPEKLLNSLLGKDYEITSREYKGTSIVELYDKTNNDNYFVAFSEGKIIFSFIPKLVEKSLDAVEEKAIGLNTKYLDVQSKIGNTGVFSVYLNYQNLGHLVNSFSAKSAETYKQRTQYISFTGISFDIDEEGLLTLESYTSFNDEAPENYLKMLTEGKTEIHSIDVIPQRLASLAKINFSSASEYFNNAMLSMGEEEYNTYSANIRKFEKKLKINLEKNLFSWMENEIVMLQTQPSNLGRDNEFAVILHAKDSAKAAKNLGYMWRQIKKNTPVKIKSVAYKSYSIGYIAFPGIIKTLFGKALEKLEKPYFTIIGNNVILSNHPQTLKNIIDDYLKKESLGNSVDYYNFMKMYNNKSSAFIYFEPPVLYHNLKAVLDTKAWSNIQKNKKYITCFNQGGLLVTKSDEMLHLLLKTQYRPEFSEWTKQVYNYSDIAARFNAPEPIVLQPKKPKVEFDTIPDIFIANLDAKCHVEYFGDSTLKLDVELKNGLKHGTLKVYHPNGELKIKGQYDEDQPTGKWKYFDEEGEIKKVDRY